MRQTDMGGEIRFKPLWRIHNSTYRRCAKGYTIKRIKRYFTKLKKIMGIRH